MCPLKIQTFYVGLKKNFFILSSLATEFSKKWADRIDSRFSKKLKKILIQKIVENVYLACQIDMTLFKLWVWIYEI